MSFDKSNLPNPVTYYEGEGLVLRGNGKWRSTQCVFHDGSKSMRINTVTGAYVCMSCGESGGDVLAYEMATKHSDFVTACKSLGCWRYDFKGEAARPSPLPPRAALEVLGFESTVVAVAAGNVAQGVALTPDDRQRVMRAAGRINRVVDIFR